MKKNLDIQKPRYSEQILPLRWPFVILLHASVNCPFLLFYSITTRKITSTFLAVLHCAAD